MADEGNIADILDALSPVKGDVDEAATDRAGTMAKLLGPAPAPKWYEAQNNVPPQPTSQNGNALPSGLNSRVPPPERAPIGARTIALPPHLDDGQSQGRQRFSPAPGTNQPAVPAGVSPSGSPTATADLATSNAATIGLGQGAYAQSLKDVDAMAAQPTEDEATARERAMQANYAIPIDPKAKDPTTGKALYKPNFATRLMRVGGALIHGGVLGTLDPAAVGATPYGAPNSDYDYAERARQAHEALAGTELTQAKDNWTAAYRRQKDVAAARSKNVTDLAPVTKAAIDQQQMPIDQQRADADAQRAQNEGRPKTIDDAIAQMNAETDPTKKAQLQATVKQMQDSAMQLRPPRQPSDHPSAELARYEDLKSAAVRANGGKPLSQDQLAKISTDLSMKQTPDGAIPQTLADRIKSRKDTAMKTAQSRLSSVKDGLDANNKPYAKEDFVRDMNQAQQAYETSIEDAGGTVNHMEMGDDLNWKAAEAIAAPVTPSQPAAPSQSSPVMPPASLLAPTPQAASSTKPVAAAPPSSLLSKYKENDVIYGRNGEAYKKIKGRWVAQ